MNRTTALVILALSSTPVTYLFCHPTVTISADNIRTSQSIDAKIKQENVLGNEEPEEFCDINGKRYYLKIDGKTVEEYVKQP